MCNNIFINIVYEGQSISITDATARADISVKSYTGCIGAGVKAIVGSELIQASGCRPIDMGQI